MRNLIRSDLYAIMRGKALYIIVAFIFLFVFMNVGSGTVGSIYMGGIGEAGLDIEEITFRFDGLNSAEAFYNGMDFLLFFLLGIIIKVAMPLFTFGTVKNDLAWGISRTKLYFSKLLLSSMFCVALVVLYMVSGILLATVVNGFGGPIPDGYWVNLFKIVGAQVLMLLAMNAIGVFLCFTFKSSLAVNSIYIALMMVPSFVMMIFMETGFNIERFVDFDILSGIIRLGMMNHLEMRSVITILCVGIFYLLASTTGGIILFKKAEIK